MSVTMDSSAIAAAVLAELMPAVTAGFEAVLAEQRMLMEAIAALELNDTVVGEMAERYNAKMAILRGGV